MKTYKQFIDEDTSSTEYLIWGVPPDGGKEDLLVSKMKGDSITNKSVAKKVKKQLESLGAKKVRIQELNPRIDPVDLFKKIVGENMENLIESKRWKVGDRIIPNPKYNKSDAWSKKHGVVTKILGGGKIEVKLDGEVLPTKLGVNELIKEK